MTNRLTLRRLILLMTLLMLFFGCSGKTIVESDLGVKGAPDWVNKGTQILNDRKGRLFHGVGEAQPMNDESLQRSTSDNRARAELAKIFSSYMDIVGNDYAVSAKSDDDISSEQAVSQQIKNLTKINLSGAKIIAYWKDKKKGTLYSLAELDLKTVKTTLQTAENMNKDLKQYFDSYGENVFDKIMKEKK